MMTISIRPYIRPTSRTTAALTPGGVAMQEGEYLSNRVAGCPITTLLYGQFSGVILGLLGWAMQDSANELSENSYSTHFGE